MTELRADVLGEEVKATDEVRQGTALPQKGSREEEKSRNKHQEKLERKQLWSRTHLIVISWRWRGNVRTQH